MANELFECESCGHIFKQGDAVKRANGVECEGDREEFFACPSCGSFDLDEVALCGECGAVVHGWVGDGVLCDECTKKHCDLETALAYGETDRTAVEINGALAFIFSSVEVEEVLKRELFDAARLRTLFPTLACEVEALLVDYCTADKSDFWSFVTKEGDR